MTENAKWLKLWMQVIYLNILVSICRLAHDNQEAKIYKIRYADKIHIF